jgi:hypothetical protein
VSDLRRKDDELLRRVIGLQLAILLAVLALLALRLEATFGLLPT